MSITLHDLWTDPVYSDVFEEHGIHSEADLASRIDHDVDLWIDMVRAESNN